MWESPYEEGPLDVPSPPLAWWIPYDGICRLHVEALVVVLHHHVMMSVVENPWGMLVHGDHEMTCGGGAHLVTYVDVDHEVVVVDEYHEMV